MNKADSVKSTVINLVLFLLIIHFFSGNAHSFTSPEEYSGHLKGSSSCTTKQCHAAFTNKQKKFVHSPVISGECSACHRAESYPNKYGVEPNQRSTCAVCHRSIDHEIQTSKFVHGPIRNGDCISCHDAHESDQQFLLRQSYSELCSSCHNFKSFYAGEFIHKPVKDGNCGLCHDPHASDYKSRLTDVGANLCVICHDDMVMGMTQDYIHAPLIKSGCSSCHDPHSGGNKLRLKESPEQLCFTCHKEKKNEVSHYIRKHKPAYEGQCITCHSPHYSEIKYLLLDQIDTLCYNCHKDQSVWKNMRFQHGPLVQGNCTSCHNPHGSDNAFILRLSFPHKFYTEYKSEKYDLCFLCHKKALVTVEETETVTNFRNGNINLHRVHVKKKKGRTCRACHDVHASDQEGRIRDEFPFGQVTIPLVYSKTKTGGSCIPGCHKERGYDRIDKVMYETE
jgi:predicted CXXCH cytochrome family protein